MKKILMNQGSKPVDEMLGNKNAVLNLDQVTPVLRLLISKVNQLSMELSAVKKQLKDSTESK